MYKWAVWLVILVILLGVPAFAQGVSVERPTLALGERWVYQTTTGGRATEFEQEVDKVDYTFEGLTGYLLKRGDRKIVVDKDLNIVAVIDATGRVATQNLPIYRWPLRVGQKFTERNARNLAGVAGVMDVEVAEAGQVKVPAGLFDGYRLEARITWSEGGQSRIIVWYAPRAKTSVKQQVYDRGTLQSETVLVRFQVSD